MTLRTTADMTGLATMIGEFASSCYDHGLLATHSNSSLFETCDVLSIMSGGRTTAVTGFTAFDEDVVDAEAIRRIGMLLSPERSADATIVAGDACITIGPGRPFVRAMRPTMDVLVIETGGAFPKRMIVIVDRERGVIHTGPSVA